MCSYGHLAHSKFAFAMDDVIINILNICFDLTLTSRINNRVRSIMPQECSLFLVDCSLFFCSLFSKMFLFTICQGSSSFCTPQWGVKSDSLAPQKRMRKMFWTNWLEKSFVFISRCQSAFYCNGGDGSNGWGTITVALKSTKNPTGHTVKFSKLSDSRDRDYLFFGQGDHL